MNIPHIGGHYERIKVEIRVKINLIHTKETGMSARKGIIKSRKWSGIKLTFSFNLSSKVLIR